MCKLKKQNGIQKAHCCILISQPNRNSRYFVEVALKNIREYRMGNQKSYIYRDFTEVSAMNDVV